VSVPESARKRVLVLEPDPEHAERLRALLTRAGLAPTLTTESRQLLEAFRRTPPEAVVVDAARAERDHLLSALRRDGASTPILVVTSPGSLADAVRLLRDGADD
jgi:DNA-binding response OmpR family regulator